VPVVHHTGRLPYWMRENEKKTKLERKKKTKLERK
jgi:hypothetical protein